ncbi:unnamed protein product, partial [Candidula unifasciata]
EPPFVFRNISESGAYSYYGYSIDVLDKITKRDGGYGLLEKGHWTGCIGNVVRGEADVILGALTVTAERDKVLDFTLPYYNFAGIQILMKKQTVNINLFYYANVFTAQVSFMRNVHGIVHVVTSVVGSHPHGDPLGHRVFIACVMSWWGTTSNRGGDPPRSLSGRLLVAGFWFFSVIMMSTFTANLAAFLTVSRMGMTITSLDDLNRQSESSVMEYFQRMAKIEKDFYERWKTISLDKTSEDAQASLAVWDYPLGEFLDSEWNKYDAMWSTIQENGLLSSNMAGVERVMSENFALITETPVVQYYTSRNCELTGIGEQFSRRPYSIGLKERSPYTDKFSRSILELQKELELSSLRLHWWASSEVNCPKETANTGLDLYSLSGTFILTGAGIILGLIVLGLEHIVTRMKRRQ